MIIKKVICDVCRNECSEYSVILFPTKEEYRCGSSTIVENGSKAVHVCKNCISGKTIDLRRVK